MQLQEIESRIDKMPLDEIEKYLELLSDKIKHTDRKISKDIKNEENSTLITLSDALQTLYDNLFEKCCELRKLSGAPEPKYFGKITNTQFEHEYRRANAINEDCAKTLERRYGSFQHSTKTNNNES